MSSQLVTNHLTQQHYKLCNHTERKSLSKLKKNEINKRTFD